MTARVDPASAAALLPYLSDADAEVQAAALNIADRVTFLGQVPSTQMPSLYHKIDVLALPSLTRPNWKEQFGRVLVEAMCSGVPVIGSDSGAIPSVIGDAGLVVPENNSQALRQGLASLVNDPELYKRIATNGRQRASENFTQMAVAQATAMAYQKLITKSHI